MAILVTSEDLKQCDGELAFQDLEKVHSIRGRLLHQSTILENLLKEILTPTITNNYKNKLQLSGRLDFDKRIKIFLEYVKENHYKGVDLLTNCMEIIRKDRNQWSHGILFYAGFETDGSDKVYKPLNFLKFNGENIPVHFKSTYFECLNNAFTNCFAWLEKNNFLHKFSDFKVLLR